MSKLARIMRKIWKLGLWSMIIGAIIAACLVAYVAWQVLYGDHTVLRKSAIVAKIKEETTLYYLDEETRIGSLFESRHRRYVPIEEIPSHLINAIVAAEDKNFYNHFGIDPTAIAIALGEGILRGGRFRRGGSTITQQTVKNIVHDWEASFARKFREMIRALQLERLYSKRQIIEFYLNQFHVAGNGNGASIAARYYFNKDIRDLNLIEAAFIAGSVKGPGKYNPFIKYTKAAQSAAKGHAFERKNYVLKRMFEQGWIEREEYLRAKEGEVPFNKGEFRTAEVALVELVQSQLKKKEILQVLGLSNAEELNTAGLKVYTTLDSKFQASAQLAMRRNLSRIETILQGFAPEAADKFKIRRSLKNNEFAYGKVVSIDGEGERDLRIHISFGLPQGLIPTASIIRTAKLLNLTDGRGWKKHFKDIVSKIKPGDILYTEVSDYQAKDHFAKLELRKRPVVSGGLIALDKGEVRAVISGFDTLGYNRAMYAKRQPGSVFKSLVFFAALHLGWSLLDKIPNIRQIFPYQGKFYFPRPDHASPYKETSMLWTGVMSENLASVALGARLLDKLNFDQFRELMSSMGYLPKPGEAPRDFHYRIARATGISIDAEGVKARQLQNAIADLEPDLVFAGEQKVMTYLKQMWWGNGYLDELAKIRRDETNDLRRRERQIRHNLLLNNYKRLSKLSESLVDDWQKTLSLVETQGAKAVFYDPEHRKLLVRFRVLNSGKRPVLGYFARVDKEEELEDHKILALPRVLGRPLNVMDVQAIWGENLDDESAEQDPVGLDQISISGIIPHHLFQKLQILVENRYNEVVEQDDRYSLQSYFHHHDFRIGLGLQYLVNLSRSAGAFSPLEPVLSFPLGTNEVTANEVAKIYQTFIEGKTYRFFKDGPDNQITFIRRIEDRFGKVLYEAKPIVHQLVHSYAADQTKEILRKIVTHGTGRRARGELFVNITGDDKTLNHIRVPVYGKTGTTNDFLTSYFAGFIPYPNEAMQPLDPKNSYTIASYIGYDRNRIMRKGRQRIYGGSGALPLWTDFCKEVIKINSFVDYFDAFDLTAITHKEWGLQTPTSSTPYLVDLPRGLIMREGNQDDLEIWRTTNISATGEVYQNLFELGRSVKSVLNLYPESSLAAFRPRRIFRPFTPAAPPKESSWQKQLSGITKEARRR